MYATAVVQVKYDEEVSAPAILIELFELQTLHPNQKPRSSGFFLHTGRFPGAHHDDGALLSTWLGAQTRLLQSSNFFWGINLRSCAGEGFHGGYHSLVSTYHFRRSFTALFVWSSREEKQQHEQEHS